MTDCTLSANGLLFRPRRSSLGLAAAPAAGVAVAAGACAAKGLLAA